MAFFDTELIGYQFDNLPHFQVSREQHQRVKSTMKHTSNSIQPRSLNNVLGNLDALHVQPFEIFEEEERQKLNAYWLVFYSLKFC